MRKDKNILYFVDIYLLRGLKVRKDKNILYFVDIYL